MTPRSTSDDLQDALAQDTAPGVLWGLAADHLAMLGFDRIIHLAFPDWGTMPDLRTTMPEEFLQTYQREGFAKDDPFLTYCLPSRVSIATGHAYLDDYDYLSGRAASLIALAAEAGFNAGYSVSLPACAINPAEGWNLGSQQSRQEVERMRRHHAREIGFLLLALRGRLSPGRHVLTARETEVMQFLVQGHRTKEIAAQMEISVVTVEFHLSNARRKLAAPTREAAVARFLQRGPGR